MSDKVKLEIFVSTDKIGSECTWEVEVDREDWEEMTLAEREDMMLEHLLMMIHWSWDWHEKEGETE